MRRRTIVFLSLLLMVTLMLGGCGASLPKLSEEENELVSEYAASLLLKYDSTNHSRLLDVTDIVTTYEEAVRAREESIKAYEEEQARLEEEKKKQDESQTVSSASVSKDDGTGGATVIGGSDEVSMTIAEFLNADGFEIVYAGNEVLSKYPEDSAGAIYPNAGKKLLIVYFNVSSSKSTTFDVVNEHASFKISVNGGNYSSNFISILDDDMSVYIDTFNANETKRLVLIFEVPTDTIVSSLDLYMESVFSGSLKTTLLK